MTNLVWCSPMRLLLEPLYGSLSAGRKACRVQIRVGGGNGLAVVHEFSEDLSGGRAETDLPVAAVGEITDPGQAEAIVATGQADAVLLGRELLRNPYWPRQAARTLGAPSRWPDQYHRVG
jgi:2,4-dienoyl-CoA reductase-like NADH-dependent reductase (Old Yellow Enzyme family)